MALLLAAMLQACKKDNPAGSELQVMAGYCYIYDVNSERLIDNSGITVALADGKAQALTTENGKWSLGGIEAGRHTLVFSKPGYGGYKVFNKNFVGGYQFADTVYLYPLPEYTVSLSPATESHEGWVSIFGYFSGELPANPGCHLFFGKDSTVTGTQPKYLYEFLMGMPYTTPGVVFQIAFSNEPLYEKGFKPGDTMYIAACSDFVNTEHYNSHPTVSYFDEELQQTIFPNLKASPAKPLCVVLK